MQHSDAISASVVSFHIDDPSDGSVNVAPTPATDASVQLMPLTVSVKAGAPSAAAAADDGTSSAMGSPVAPADAPAASSPSTLAQRRPLAAPDVTQSRPAEATGKQKLRMIGETCSYLMFVLYPTIVGILMGLYYLYVAFEDREVYAFAVIWLIFVIAMSLGLVYSWRVRAKDARLLAAEHASSDSDALKHSAVNVAHEEHKSA